MIKELRDLMLRRDLITVAAGLLMALAAFYLLEAVVSGLIAPLISIFFGDPTFEVSAFTISGSEFRYGFVLEAAITFVLAVALIYLMAHRGNQGGEGRAATRACPECTSSISAVAKRCPFCTAVVQPDPAS